MIDRSSLTESDIGRWVEYHGYDGWIEKGRIKSWNDKYIFVVYKCNGEWCRFQDFTGTATSPEDLFFSEAKAIQGDKAYGAAQDRKMEGR